MNALVSIIITTYKGTDTLERAIRSVLNQTYKDIEVIVVDDNEPDSVFRMHTKGIINRFTDSRIIYIECSKHINGAYARNVGIRKARGGYISFLDDDDYYCSKRVERCVSELESQLEYSSVYTNALVIFENYISSITSVQESGNLQKKLLLNKNLLGTGSNMFFSRVAVENTGFFDESFERHQDVEYMIRFFEKNKILALPEYLVVKVNNNGKNIPDINKLDEIKRKFIFKFLPMINKLNTFEYSEFITHELRELYLVGVLKKESNKKIEKICCEFAQTYKGTLGYKTKIKIKVKAKMKPYFNKIIWYIKKRKHNQMINADKEIKNCYLEFREST